MTAQKGARRDLPASRRAAVSRERLALITSRERLSVAQVRIALKESNGIHLTVMVPGILQNVQAVPDVDHVDQAVADDRVAPEHDLVRAPAQRGVLDRYRVERRR